MLPVTATTSAWTQCAFGLLGFSSEAIGPAAATMTRHSGTTMITVQVSSAEVIWPTRAFSAGSRPARSAERASTGTIALVSAPPRISWYRRSGTWFAVTYAVPRQLAPTVCENTSVRTRPRIRDRIGQAGDDEGAAGDARSQPPKPARLRQASLRAGLHMQLPVPLHARPPSSHALSACRIRIQLETYLSRRGPDHRST